MQTEEDLALLSEPELIELLRRDGDRVPRAVIDTCVSRGEPMLRLIDAFIMDDDAWRSEFDEAAFDAWWLRAHSIMILGLMTSERAGVLLAKALERTDQDRVLHEWSSDSWPALFENKPLGVLPALETAFQRDCADPFVRINIAQALVSVASRADSSALDRVLAMLAEVAADERADWDLRIQLGDLLLSFPRPAHRALLDRLAKGDGGAVFTSGDVKKIYARGVDDLDWKGDPNPWSFYAPDEIALRESLAKKAALNEDADFDDDVFVDAQPYTHEMPKIGRNDPCPCGSGKKYKKCCLENEQQ